MRRTFQAGIVSAMLGGTLAGCSGSREARYVYQDGQYGVIGIPQNTKRWPHNYRGQADNLMESHFPDGYEIVRAEEVEEGDRILDSKSASEREYEPSLGPKAGTFLKLGKHSAMA